MPAPAAPCAASFTSFAATLRQASSRVGASLPASTTTTGVPLAGEDAALAGAAGALVDTWLTGTAGPQPEAGGTTAIAAITSARRAGQDRETRMDPPARRGDAERSTLSHRRAAMGGTG